MWKEDLSWCWVSCASDELGVEKIREKECEGCSRWEIEQKGIWEMRNLIIMELRWTNLKDKERPKAAQVIKVLELEVPFPKSLNLCILERIKLCTFHVNFNITL